MRAKNEFGIVVFLDALGARTTDITVSRDYLIKVNSLKDRILLSKQLTGIAMAKTLGGSRSVQWIPARLKIRYFGDSILITYPLPSECSLRRQLYGTFIIINELVFHGLAMGILFRGAVSLGRYLEKQDILLGPAVTDAANWYDRSDMIGVMLTPATSHYLNAVCDLTAGTTVKRRIDLRGKSACSFTSSLGRTGRLIPGELPSWSG